MSGKGSKRYVKFSVAFKLDIETIVATFTKTKQPQQKSFKIYILRFCIPVGNITLHFQTFLLPFLPNFCMQTLIQPVCRCVSLRNHSFDKSDIKLRYYIIHIFYYLLCLFKWFKPLYDMSHSIPEMASIYILFNLFKFAFVYIVKVA